MKPPCENNISIPGMGQFACPGDVPICYGGSAEFGTGALASITEMMSLSRHPFKAHKTRHLASFQDWYVRSIVASVPLRNCSSSDTNVCSTHSRGVGDSTGTVRGLPVEIDVDHRRGPAPFRMPASRRGTGSGPDSTQPF